MSLGSPPWSPPTAALWAILSCYAPEVRRDKAVAFLRAFTDDSASEIGDRRLFFAGFVHRAEQWALFAEAWDKELKTEPSIRYLKTSEAQNLKGQFLGWRRELCEAKLLALANVIHRYRPISFQFSIDRQKFDAILKPVSPRGLASAHFNCYFGIISGVTRFAASLGGNIPIEFIFDKQDGVSIDVQLWFDAMKTGLPRKIRKLISGTPLFRDDKDMLQLQAADLLVWYLRREHEHRENDNGSVILDLIRRSGKHLFCGEINEALMTKWADHHRRLPAIDLLKTKPQWRNFKKEMGSLLSSGFIPPRGTRWKNAIYYAREFIARLFHP